MRRSHLALVVGLVTLTGCASDTKGNKRDTMTQRQKDSVLAQTGLPGAQGVAKALRAADSAKARQAQIDSASRP